MMEHVQQRLNGLRVAQLPQRFGRLPSLARVSGLQTLQEQRGGARTYRGPEVRSAAAAMPCKVLLAM